MFTKQFAEQYINKLFKKHKIEIYKWSATSCGHAYKKTRKIKAPKPTNIDRFAVCLHEIFHVIGRKGSSKFEKEFYCDAYARGILVELGYDTTEWDKRTKWHVLSRIAMAHNRGLNHSKINSEIRAFFPEIDFNKWLNKKIFVGYKYSQTIDPKDIEIYENISLYDIEHYLKELGLKIIKSQYDDSTYNHYIVSEIADYEMYGEEFETLREVIKRYDLSVLKQHYKIAV
jgi:hypothetical protein